MYIYIYICVCIYIHTHTQTYRQMVSVIIYSVSMPIGPNVYDIYDVYVSLFFSILSIHRFD